MSEITNDLMSAVKTIKTDILQSQYKEQQKPLMPSNYRCISALVSIFPKTHAMVFGVQGQL